MQPYLLQNCLFIFSNLVIWVVLHFEWFSNAVANLPVTLVHAAVIELMSEQDIKGLVFCHHFLTLMSFQTSSENCIACEMHLHVDSAFLLESHISSPPKSEFSKFSFSSLNPKNCQLNISSILRNAVLCCEFWTVSLACLCASGHHSWHKAGV